MSTLALTRRKLLAGIAATTTVGLALRESSVGAEESDLFRRNKSLSKGLNASQWFEWVPPSDTPGRAKHLGKYRAEDFSFIRELGFDHVRVTIQPNFLSPKLLNGDPTLHPKNLAVLDQAMSQILRSDLALVLDCHPAKEIKDKMAANPNFLATMAKWWELFAEHVSHSPRYSPDRTFLELLNEPERSMDEPNLYRKVIESLAAAARKGAPHYTLIVGGNRMNIPEALFQGDYRPLADANIIYTFHFYQPMAFTHQSMPMDYYRNLKAVPWDFDAGSLSESDIARFDPKVQTHMRNYASKPRRKADLRWYFDELGKWRDSHNTFVWLGEFGVHSPGTNPRARAAWIRDTRQLAEEYKFGWCMYEARGGFGLFVGMGEERPLRVNGDVLAALGMKSLNKH